MYGRTAIEPVDDVDARSVGTWVLRYTASDRGLTAGSRIEVYTDSDTDWAPPRLVDPLEPDYMALKAPVTSWISDVVRNAKSIGLRVEGGSIGPGAEIILTYGDTSGGGLGTRTQSFAELSQIFLDPDPGQPGGRIRHPGILALDRRWEGGMPDGDRPICGGSGSAV